MMIDSVAAHAAVRVTGTGMFSTLSTHVLRLIIRYAISNDLLARPRPRLSVRPNPSSSAMNQPSPNFKLAAAAGAAGANFAIGSRGPPAYKK